MQFKSIVTFFLLAMLFPQWGMAQVTGDYRSVASGGYATAATWEKYSGTAWAPATAAPGSTANVTIQTGHTISLNGSTSNSLTLIVQSGASIIADGTAQRSLRVYGTSLVNNGNIGGAFANDSINIEVAGNGLTFTLSGTGLTKVNRLRVLGALTGTTVIVDQDAIFNNTGSTGGSAVGFTNYYGSTSTTADNITATINAGRTLSFTGGGTLHYASTTTASTSGNYTYNVNGTLDLTGSTGTTYMIPNSVNSASLLKMNVSGLLKVGAKFTAINASPGATPGAVQLIVNPGGVVDASAASIFTLGTTPFIMGDGTAVMKRVVAAIDTSFPVCTATGGYNSLTLNNAGTTDTFSVKLKNTFDVILADATKVVNRQWTIGESVAGGSNLSIKLSWLAADQAASFNSSTGVNIYVVDGSGVQTIYPATVAGSGTLASPYVASATGITTMGKVFVGNNGIVLPANNVPFFTGGNSQSLTVCANAAATAINAQLAVNDADAGQTETWSVVTAAAHGTAAAAYSTTSAGAVLTPTGLTYTPTAGYSGADSFTVRVTDGTDADTIKIYVTVTPLPNAGSISGSSSVCAGSTVTLSTTGSGGSWVSGNSFAAVGSSTGIVTGTSAGVALISYTVSGTCGSSTATVNVTVNPSGSGISAGTISGPSSVCIGSVITLTDATSGGVWSASNARATVSVSGVVTGSSAGVDTILYTVTTTCGSSAAVQVVTINALPNAGTITGAASVCAGSAITLADAATGGSWDSGNAFATVGSSTGIVTGVSPGSGIISYTVSGPCGSATTTTNVLVNPSGAGVDAGTISGPSVVCAGATITLTDATTGGVWSAKNTFATVSGVGVVSGVTAGIDTILYTVTNVCGSAAATRIVTVNPLPVAGSITGSATVCMLSAITLADVATGGSWSATNAHASVSSTGVITPLSPGVDTIVYTVSNSCGTATATKTITVNALANAGSVSGSSTVCVATGITLSDGATGGSWSAANTTAAVSATGVVTGLAAGVDTISYTVINTCNTAIALKVITVNPLPIAGTISGPSSVCESALIVLATTGSGGVWSVSNSHAAINTSGVVAGVSAGVDTVSYTVTNSCGTSIANKMLTVNPLATVGAVSGASSVCASSSITLANAVSGGVWTASNTHATVSSTGVVTGVAAGVDTIYYSVTNSCNTATASKIITINPLPVAGPIAGTLVVCEAATTTLSGATAGGAWSVSNANAAITPAGVVSAVTSGWDTVTYSVTNICGTATATAVVTVNPLPVSGTITGLSSVCVASVIALTDAASGGVWSSSNASASINAAGIVTGITAGIDTFNYTVTNSCGIAIAAKIVTINPLPFAGAIAGTSVVCEGASVTLSVSATGGGWSASNSNAVVSSTGVVSGFNHGADTISYSVTNVCGTAIAISIVTVNPLPHAGVITGSGSLCVGSSVTLAGVVTGGTWSASNALATVAAGLVTGASAGIDTIAYTYTNSCGSDVAYRVITVNPLPFAGAITGATSVCEGITATLSNPASGGVWSGSSAIASVDATGIVTGISAGVDTISYSVTNVCGTAVAAFYIAVNPQPVAGVITGIDTLCQGDTTSFFVTMPGGVWSSTTPAYALVSGSGLIGGIAPGIDTILYTVTNTCGTAIARKTIKVISLAVCAGTSSTGVVADMPLAVKVFPNPSNGLFTATITAPVTGAATLSIYNLHGQRIKTIVTTTNSTSNITMDNCAAGLYYLNVTTANSSTTEQINIK